MSKITSVEPQLKNKRRFNIFLDGQFAFGADEDLVVERRLVIGKEINPDDMEKILSEAEVCKLVEKVYGLLNVRYRSEKEIRDYMRNLSFKRKLKDKEELSEVVVEALIEKLKKRDLINDLRFAAEWIEARRKSKKKGINALKSELYQKGIHREIIDEVLNAENTESGAEEKLAIEALEKKLRIWKNLPEPEFKQKSLQFLMRKGFNYDLAKQVIENSLKEGV
jgi:regulatory protein